jgi:hypothetical protein
VPWALIALAAALSWRLHPRARVLASAPT